MPGDGSISPVKDNAAAEEAARRAAAASQQRAADATNNQAEVQEDAKPDVKANDQAAFYSLGFLIPLNSLHK